MRTQMMHPKMFEISENGKNTANNTRWNSKKNIADASC